jgi:hypothetical protein
MFFNQTSIRLSSDNGFKIDMSLVASLDSDKRERRDQKSYLVVAEEEAAEAEAAGGRGTALKSGPLRV